MSPNTDPAEREASPRQPTAAGKPATQSKPRLALFIATAGGLGYLKPGPGTWGSLAGAALAAISFRMLAYPQSLRYQFHGIVLDPAQAVLWITIVVALVGTWSAHRAAAFLNVTDPQVVVIDEVSGQLITLVLAAGQTQSDRTHIYDLMPPGLGQGLLNWKYLLVGFILFRAFDIWKPFPVRQAEKLPGGWGIMADDWVAALYAALGLWVARALGL